MKSTSWQFNFWSRVAVAHAVLIGAAQGLAALPAAVVKHSAVVPPTPSEASVALLIASDIADAISAASFTAAGTSLAICGAVSGIVWLAEEYRRGREGGRDHG